MNWNVLGGWPPGQVDVVAGQAITDSNESQGTE